VKIETGLEPVLQVERKSETNGEEEIVIFKEEIKAEQLS
jgi:hypothetical protein